MDGQIWTINAYISGTFFLVTTEELSSSTPPHPLIRKLQILPEFYKDNKQTGVFNLIIDFIVDAKEKEKPEAELIADLARDIFNYYVNLLTFITGNEIKQTKPIDLKHELPAGGRFRTILFENKIINLAPPVPLKLTYLLKDPIESKLSRCLAFYTYGIKEKDILTSIYFLLSALDMVSAQFKIHKKIVRECENCGYKKEIEAGTAAKVKYVMVNIAGFSEEDFRNIWEIRNSIFHGYFTISAKSVREIIEKRNIVRIALTKAIKKLLDLNESDSPTETVQNWLSDPLLDIEYTKND